MKRPLVTGAVWFFLGIGAGLRLPVGWSVCYAAALACVSAGYAARFHARWFGRFCAAAMFALGVCCAAMRLMTSASDIARVPFVRPAPARYVLYGEVASAMEVSSGKTSFMLEARQIASRHLRRRCCGTVMVSVAGTVRFVYGQRLAMEVTLQRPAALSLQHHGVRYLARVSSPAQIHGFRGIRPGAWPKRLAAMASERIRLIFRRRLSPAAAGIASAMVIGDRSGVSALVYDAMMRTGTVHILVVSGFNVGIIASISVLLLKTLRLSRRLRFFLCAPIVVFYCLVSGASDPVVRATVMALVCMAAYVVKEEPDIRTACSIAGLLILWCQPQQLFDIGFQLSFASVISLISVYPWLKARFCLEKIRSRAIAYVAEAALVSLCCWLATAGLIAYYFRMISPVTVLANIVIVPLATLLTLSACSLIAAVFVSPYLAWCFAPVIELLVFVLVQLNFLLLKIPGASLKLSF